MTMAHVNTTHARDAPKVRATDEDATSTTILGIRFVPGCTDAEACNYDATATIDDDSCEYDTCAGCTEKCMQLRCGRDN